MSNDFFFDRFPVATSEAEPRPRWWQRLGALTAFPVLAAFMGALSSLMFVPHVMAVNHSVQGAQSMWDAIPSELPVHQNPQRSKIVDKDGNEIAQFYAEDRVELTYDQIPQVMKDAQISIEDTRFFEREWAIDTRALARAVAGNVLNRGGYGGGSTLEQQYVKNILLYDATSDEERAAATERSITRKIKEMRYAIELTQSMSKEDILLGYLNIANYGEGAYGVEAAARRYWSIPAKDLSLAQAATLAGIVQNPSKDPVDSPQQAKDRRDTVLSKMLQYGRITTEEYEAATAEELNLKVSRPPNGCLTSDYPYYCEQVLKTLRHDPQFEKDREQLLYKGGLTIRTAMDPKAMQVANEVAAKGLGTKNQYAAGIAIVQPGTGHVVGFGQNRTFDQTQVTYAASGFQNGSTFKPITLAAALEDGWNISSKLDAPGAIKRGGKRFTNQTSTGIGTMDAADALAVSSNTFFVKLETDVTSVAATQRMAERLGIDLPDDVTGEETSTTLGVYDASPIETANVYATFAASGVACNPTYITKIEGPGVDITYDSQCRQELEPGVADTVAHALATVVDGPNESRTGEKMSIGRPVMGKTGTTTGNSSVWFAGGTPQYAVAVWVGDPRGGYKYPVNRVRVYGETVGAAGSTAAGPLWKDTMQRLHRNVPVKQFSKPNTVRQSIVVPNVQGMSTTAAITVLQDAGMTVKIKSTTSGGDAADVVVSQSPGAGAPLSRAGGEVELTLSDGSDTEVVVGN